METKAKDRLTERMNALAAELASLEPNAPRRVEIITELSRLSLLSASAKEQTKDG